MEVKDKIKQRRKELGLTQLDIAKKVGVSEPTVCRWENGEIANMRRDKIVSLAEALNVAPAFIMDDSDIPSPDTTEAYTTFPVIGDVAAGYEQIAVEDWEGDKIDIPLSWLGGRPHSDYMVLRVKGDSMFPEYQDGDKVLVLKQDTMDYSGQIGVVLFDDDHITVKRVEYKPGENWMRLVPINPNYPRELIENEALEHCCIRGIPVKLIRDITK